MNKQELLLKKLFEYQEKQCLSQSEIAGFLDVNKNTITNWKKNPDSMQAKNMGSSTE